MRVLKRTRRIMFYEITDNYSKLRPIEFYNFSNMELIEKQLEDLLAQNLFDVLFFQMALLPFHQESSGEAVADIYALNERGDIVIIELKRAVAYSGALDQLLRYTGIAGQWGYNEIESKYQKYNSADNKLSLIKAHAKAFELEPGRELSENDFNRKQHLWVIGSAASEELIRSTDYWRSNGLSIDFFPYRVFQINNKNYLEFFSKPYDYHLNPADSKGMLFDTNGTYDHGDGYECLREMFASSKISAYGTRKDAILSLQTNDYVFYSQVGKGIVGAAIVKGRNIKKVQHLDHGDEWYWDVELLTDVPNNLKYISTLMSFSEVKNLLGKNFYWARIDKRPYLSIEESKSILKILEKKQLQIF